MAEAPIGGQPARPAPLWTADGWNVRRLDRAGPGAGRFAGV